MTKRISFILLFLSFRIFAVDPSFLKAQIGKWVEAEELTPKTGVAVGIVYQGTSLAFGFGYRDRVEKLPVDEKTLFSIASLSKAFTGLAITLAEQRGALERNRSVRRFVPQFQLYNSDVSERITLIDMLAHRSGLPRHDFLSIFSPFSRNEIFNRLQFLPPNPEKGFGFREAFQYNNLMYMAAGVVLEQTTKTSWEDYLAKHVFSPLNFKFTNTSVEETLKSTNHAKPYCESMELDYFNCENIGPACSVISNVSDLNRWIEFFLNDGMINGKALLSKEHFRSLFKPYTRYPGAGENAYYGLGWVLNDFGGTPVRGHGGHTPGFRSHLSFLPEKKIGIVILTNNEENAILQTLPVKIYDLLLKEKVNAQFPMESFTESRKALEERNSQRNLASFVGQYQHPGYGTISIVRQNSEFWLKYYLLKLKLTLVDGSWVGVGSYCKWNFSIPVKFHSSSDQGFTISFEPNSIPLKFEKTDNITRVDHSPIFQYCEDKSSIELNQLFLP